MPAKTPTLANVHKRLTAVEDCQKTMNGKLDDVLSILGPDSPLRKYGKTALKAVFGAAIYAGFIDGKVGMFLSKLLGIG